MRLLEPGVGEIVDRLSILNLKILFGKEKAIDTAHFEKESVGLYAKIRSRTLNGPWFGLSLELAAVNAALWHAEDDLRIARVRVNETQKVPGSSHLALTAEAGEIGIRIQGLNDQRAALVAGINREAGDTDAAEKLTS